jgi:anti-sigma B factor antagonist
VPNYVILVSYKDSYNRTGTARLKLKAATPQEAVTRARRELSEIEKFSRRKNIRSFDLDSIQVVQQANPTVEEGLLISRNNIFSGVEVWELKGTIDAHTNKQFEDLIEEAAREGVKCIVFDFKGLAYINSTGIGTIISASADTSIKIADMPQKIMEVFTVVGLDELLDTYYSVEEALADIKKEHRE